MTTLTTILGMIPMAFFGGENAMMIKPIGLTVVGGLTSATFITLFFIPVVYSLLNERKRPTDRAVQDNALPGTQDTMEEVHAH
jgi:HAE1 family hydrophobic/amphiphilic exporter-1